MSSGLDRPEHRLVRIGHYKRLAVYIPDDLRNAWFNDALEHNAIETGRHLRIVPDAAVVLGRCNGHAHGALDQWLLGDRITRLLRPGPMRCRDRQRDTFAVRGLPHE